MMASTNNNSKASSSSSILESVDYKLFLLQFTEQKENVKRQLHCDIDFQVDTLFQGMLARIGEIISNQNSSKAPHRQLLFNNQQRQQYNNNNNNNNKNSDDNSDEEVDVKPNIVFTHNNNNNNNNNLNNLKLTIKKARFAGGPGSNDSGSSSHSNSNSDNDDHHHHNQPLKPVPGTSTTIGNNKGNPINLVNHNNNSDNDSSSQQQLDKWSNHPEDCQCVACQMMLMGSGPEVNIAEEGEGGDQEEGSEKAETTGEQDSSFDDDDHHDQDLEEEEEEISAAIAAIQRGASRSSTRVIHQQNLLKSISNKLSGNQNFNNNHNQGHQGHGRMSIVPRVTPGGATYFSYTTPNMMNHHPHLNLNPNNNKRGRKRISPQQSKEDSAIRLFSCRDSGCSRQFTKRRRTVQHERIHLGIKPYSCTRCGYATSNSSDVVKHIRTVHKVDRTESAQYQAVDEVALGVEYHERLAKQIFGTSVMKTAKVSG